MNQVSSAILKQLMLRRGALHFTDDFFLLWLTLTLKKIFTFCPLSQTEKKSRQAVLKRIMSS